MSNHPYKVQIKRTQHTLHLLFVLFEIWTVAVVSSFLLWKTETAQLVWAQ